MNDASILPVAGWADEWASYSMKVIGAVVAFIRDHGPASDDMVLAQIRRSGFGADIRKASPFFDDDDGARRVLNLLISDIDEIGRDAAGRLCVAPDVVAVTSRLKGARQVPSAEQRADDAARARHIEHLRRWLFTNPFTTVWRDGIRRHTPDELAEMVLRIDAIGYCGPPIVRDQLGNIMDGHLRHDALVLLDGWNPDEHTETWTFENDRHRLAWIIAMHQQGNYFPTDMKNAIIAVVRGALARSGEKVTWTLADIATIVGGQHKPPIPALTPAAVFVPTPHETTMKAVKKKPVKEPTDLVLSPMKRQVLRLLVDAAEPVTADAIAAILGKPRDHVSPRLAELRRVSYAEVVGRGGNQLWSATAAGEAALNAPYRPPLGVNRPGVQFREGGVRSAAAQRLIQASRRPGEERWVPRSLFTVQKTDIAFRQVGWFVVQREPWLFIPDRLAEDYTKARVRRLSVVEAGDLNAALADSSFWDEWERLLNREDAG